MRDDFGEQDRMEFVTDGTGEKGTRFFLCCF